MAKTLVKRSQHVVVKIIIEIKTQQTFYTRDRRKNVRKLEN